MKYTRGGVDWYFCLWYLEGDNTVEVNTVEVRIRF